MAEQHSDVTSAGTGAGGLGTPAARWSFVFIVFCGALTGLVDGSFSPFSPAPASAYVAGVVGALILTTPGARRLRPGQALTLVPIALYIAVVALSTAPEVGRSWPLNFAAYLVAFLTARGNPFVGAGGSLLLVALATGWAIPQQPSAIQLAHLLGVPLSCLLVGIVWRLVLRFVVGRERAHRSAGARSAEQAGASSEALEASRREFNEIHAELAPLLGPLMAGVPVDEGMRARFRNAEADVRDRFRAPHLRHPELTATISRLRERGVTVVVLGEPTSVAERIDEGLAARIVSELHTMTEGRVTIRTLPPGQGAAISLLLDPDGDSRRILLSARGEEILHSHSGGRG